MTIRVTNIDGIGMNHSLHVYSAYVLNVCVFVHVFVCTRWHTLFVCVPACMGVCIYWGYKWFLVACHLPPFLLAYALFKLVQVFRLVLGVTVVVYWSWNLEWMDDDASWLHTYMHAKMDVEITPPLFALWRCQSQAWMKEEG